MLERIGKMAYHLDLAASKHQALRGLHNVFTSTPFDATGAMYWITKHYCWKLMVNGTTKSKLNGSIVSFREKYSTWSNRLDMRNRRTYGLLPPNWTLRDKF